VLNAQQRAAMDPTFLGPSAACDARLQLQLGLSLSRILSAPPFFSTILNQAHQNPRGEPTCALPRRPTRQGLIEQNVNAASYACRVVKGKGLCGLLVVWQAAKDLLLGGAALAALR
jgi:hypothetical protein